VLADFRALPITEQKAFLQALKSGSSQGRSPAPEREWITLKKAAEILEKSPSVVSRMAKAGKLKSNGLKHNKYRLLVYSVLAALCRDVIRMCRREAAICRRWPPRQKEAAVFEEGVRACTIVLECYEVRELAYVATLEQGTAMPRAYPPKSCCKPCCNLTRD
jgi:hypothetical protein